MRRFAPKILIPFPVVLLSAAAVYAGTGTGSGTVGKQPARAAAASADIPLKDAKLNIEHNATDEDTGFQGFIDSEGWRRLEIRGPWWSCGLLRGPWLAR